VPRTANQFHQSTFQRDHGTFPIHVVFLQTPCPKNAQSVSPKHISKRKVADFYSYFLNFVLATPCYIYRSQDIITYSKGRRGEKWSLPWIRASRHPSRHPSVHPSGRPCGWTPWKLRSCRLHTIPLLSLTLQLSAHQEWEGNKPGMK